MTAGEQTTERPVARKLRAAGEILLLALVFLAPWPFGCVLPRDQFLLSIGVFALVGVWAARTVATRRFTYTADPVSLCLLGLVLLSAVQLIPLPESLVRILSPTAADWHRALLPETPELLPGETEASIPSRTDWFQMSVAPAATEDMLAQFLMAFLVYAAARNFVARRAPFQRLAWVGFATGLGLAVLGLLQYLSGAKTRLYWRIENGSLVFGPFANKNHFAFQLNMLAGLAGGLFLWVARKPGGWRSPPGLALLGGLGLMAVAVGFSQSRGGVIAGLAAAALVCVLAWSARSRSSTGSARAVLVLVGGIAIVAVLLTAWFGFRGATERLATLWSNDADNRSADWRSVWPLVEQFPAIGVGGGGLARAEPMVRTRSNISYEFNTLDNEYLEDLVEGGIPRCVLSLALVIAALWPAVVGYRRNPDHPNAPLLLGSAFGLAAVCFQSAGDFGMHIPSVALTAAVIAAYSGAASREAGTRSRREPFITGRAAYTAATILVFAGLLVVLSNWRAYRVDRLRAGASTLLRSSTPTRLEDAIRYLELATTVRSNDPAAWDELTAAHLIAAREPSADASGHILEALKSARASRACQPLGVAPHITLGDYADRFARSEPATAHFDRAKRVAGFNSYIWYVSGQSAATHGDWSAAISDWRESFARSLVQLEPITREAATHLPPDELRTLLLPDDPAVWYTATPFVFPRPNDPGRMAWLKAIADRWGRGPEPGTVANFVAWGTALEELGDIPAALHVWRRATERFPDEIELRDRLARRFESEEMYEEAVPVLEWLTAKHPDRGDYRHRLEAAGHALKLKAEIDRP
jgi:tetratricopeptide (TPR) repeat protein